MAKLYVAGKDLIRARAVMDLLCSHGHEISFDWVDNWINNEDLRGSADVAIKEYKAISESDALVYLWENDQESARYEAGMAMGLNKPIVASGGDGVFFFQLPHVYCVHNDNEISVKLNEVLGN